MQSNYDANFILISYEIFMQCYHENPVSNLNLIIKFIIHYVLIINRLSRYSNGKIFLKEKDMKIIKIQFNLNIASSNE